MENAKKYKELIKQHTPPSPITKDISFAFIFGGGICLLGELLSRLYRSFGMESDDAYLTVTVTVILVSAVLTSLGIFDGIARFAGAGTLVPVSGFANSVVSCALDTKNEGLILGIGSGIFTVAGPVILYSTLFGTLWGVIYYLIGLFT